MAVRAHRVIEASSAPDPQESAQDAGLRYVSDSMPGVRRRQSGRGFSYVDPEGRPVRDARNLARIRSLAIPPAWSDVWICPTPAGHLQATGRDAAGRKQYRYHPRWRKVRDEAKYGRLASFAEALPRIRARVERDLSRRGLPRERVLATVIRLLETSLIRVGNEEYARENGSFGLTTMRNRHLEVRGSTLRFRFRGKGGKLHEVDVSDARLARIVGRCQEIPGHELFQYVDEGGSHRTIESADVNEYLREISGSDFTAKDFRTWAGTMLAVSALQEFEENGSEEQAKGNVARAIESVAERMGNTPRICRACYVHPAVLEAYLDGTLPRAPASRGRSKGRSAHGLDPQEQAVLTLLSARTAAA